MDSGLREHTAVASSAMDTGSNRFADLAGSPILDEHSAGDAERAMLARSITAARRKLGAHLEAALFANPGLDIMLFLFAEGLDGATVTTNACCAAAGVPRTTALRWIKLLQDRGLVTGSDDVSDRRVTMLALSATGRATIRTWLTEIAALPLQNPTSADH